MVRFKDKSIGFHNLQAQLVLALIVVDQVMQKHGQEALITSINDANHAKTSLHYSGNAVDIRSYWFSNSKKVLNDCKEALGHHPDFDIILESDHFHLEYQPKRRD